ncbi:hypothetical protein [Aestuariivirga sp.]|uniref:hypothetical protein n=1 Tax=Aestuariivirga sp. TaxID=2650926 RepID=UPI0025C5C6F6|nr:hypothetical protein [Aestuariivirga sp.]MCA3556196.1 hypothetical protein [Aestuariivirga sp.]
MPNITLAMDEELLAAARAFARAEGTTLNALVRKLLAGAMAKEAQREEARLGLIELMKSSAGRLPDGFKIDRDEIYGGPLLPRHKHPGLRRGRKR